MSHNKKCSKKKKKKKTINIEQQKKTRILYWTKIRHFSWFPPFSVSIGTLISYLVISFKANHLIKTSQSEKNTTILSCVLSEDRLFSHARFSFHETLERYDVWTSRIRIFCVYYVYNGMVFEELSKKVLDMM